MSGTPLHFDSPAVLRIADRIDAAASAITTPTEPAGAVDRFASSTSVVDATTHVRAQLAQLTAALVAFASEIRTATTQFHDVELVNAARLALP
ncbi:MAG: hypothetical protein ACSLE6_15080 [Mycobacterium sp.]